MNTQVMLTVVQTGWNISKFSIIEMILIINSMKVISTYMYLIGLSGGTKWFSSTDFTRLGYYWLFHFSSQKYTVKPLLSRPPIKRTPFIIMDT